MAVHIPELIYESLDACTMKCQGFMTWMDNLHPRNHKLLLARKCAAHRDITLVIFLPGQLGIVIDCPTVNG